MTTKREGCYQLNKRALHPNICLVVGSGLCAFVLVVLSTRQGNWHPLLLPVGGGSFLPLVVVMVRGDSWQKMVAAALLFVVCFGLLVSVMD